MDQTKTPATLIAACRCLNIRIHLHRKHQQDVNEDGSWEKLRTNVSTAHDEVERGWRLELGMGGITAEQRGLLAVHEPARGWTLLECINCHLSVCSFRRNTANMTDSADSRHAPSWETGFSPIDGVVFVKDGVLRGREFEKVRSSEAYSRAFHLVIPASTGAEKKALQEERFKNLRPEFLRLLRSIVTATSTYVTGERQEMEDRIAKYKASQLALLETRRQQAIEQQEDLWSEIVRIHEGEVYDENEQANGNASVDEELLRLQKHIESPYGQSLRPKSSGNGLHTIHHVGDAPSLSIDQTAADLQRNGFSLRRRPSLNLESDVAASLKMQQFIDAERDLTSGIKTGPGSLRSSNERRASASGFNTPPKIADVPIKEEEEVEGSRHSRIPSERVPRRLELTESRPTDLESKVADGDEIIFQFDETSSLNAVDEAHTQRDNAANTEATLPHTSRISDQPRRFSIGSSDSEAEEDEMANQGANTDTDTCSGYGRSVPVAISHRNTLSKAAALACEAIQTGDMEKMERASHSLHTWSTLPHDNERTQTTAPSSRTSMSRSMAVTSRSRNELGGSYVRPATAGDAGVERSAGRRPSTKYLGGTDDDLDERTKPFIAPHILAEQEEQESLFIGSLPHRSRKFSSAI